MFVRGYDVIRMFGFKSGGIWMTGWRYDIFKEAFKKNSTQGKELIHDYSKKNQTIEDTDGTEYARYQFVYAPWKSIDQYVDFGDLYILGNLSHSQGHKVNESTVSNPVRLPDEFISDAGSKSLFWITGGYTNFAKSSFDKSVPVYTTRSNWYTILTELITLKEVAIKAQAAGNASQFVKGNRIISDLASYFKYSAIETKLSENDIAATEETGKIRIESMLMYAVLVGQSLILFIAYIKRLFYVLILAMMAPIVVVMDFFQKFGK